MITATDADRFPVSAKLRWKRGLKPLIVTAAAIFASVATLSTSIEYKLDSEFHECEVLLAPIQGQIAAKGGTLDQWCHGMQNIALKNNTDFLVGVRALRHLGLAAAEDLRRRGR
jgi:hypothetical protein